MISIQPISGWILNPNSTRVANILNAVERAGGNCPCVAKDTWSEDTICPCLYFRSGQGCHCTLYVREPV